jgi:hypothetical protein
LQSQASGLDADESSLSAGILEDWTMFRCVTGSRAYGLEQDQSDTDVRGVFVAPPDLLWSLQGAPDYLERGEMEEAYWEVRKFCILALKANPNILECLYSPIVLATTPAGDELLSIRSSFLSRFVHQTFNGYVLSQFKKIERDFQTTGAPKWKHVMHLIRLLISGITLLSTGNMEVQALEHRERLLLVRHGGLPWGEVEAWRLSLHQDFDDALAMSPLPELPNYALVEEFLLGVRRRAVAGVCP